MRCAEWGTKSTHRGEHMGIRTGRFTLIFVVLAASGALVGCCRSVTPEGGTQILTTDVSVAMEAFLTENIWDLCLTDTAEYDGRNAICVVATLPRALEHDVIVLDSVAIAALDQVQESVPETQAVGVVLRFIREDDSTWWEQVFDTREYWYGCEPGTTGDPAAIRDCITVFTAQDVARRLGDPGEIEGESMFIGRIMDVDAEMLRGMAHGEIAVPDLVSF